MVSSFRESKRILYFDSEDAQNQTILKALASRPRLKILKLLKERDLNISEIAGELQIPLSTVTMHVAVLEKAGLIYTGFFPAARGMQKVCCRAYDHIWIDLPNVPGTKELRTLEYSMPVGSFVNCDVTPSCGLATNVHLIGDYDDPASFYEPERMNAQLIWWRAGFLEYRFPNHLTQADQLEGLQFSLEVCSEAPLHDNEWPSDITLWINDVEIGTWTSPGDFGGQRGALTPEWWANSHSQFGLLKKWEVNSQGSLLDEGKLSNVRLDDLNLHDHCYISVCIGIKADAHHVGGINLFGKGFGNFPQDLVLRLLYNS
jgi:predicted transcriptional regulator